MRRPIPALLFIPSSLRSVFVSIRHAPSPAIRAATALRSKSVLQWKEDVVDTDIEIALPAESQ